MEPYLENSVEGQIMKSTRVLLALLVVAATASEGQTKAATPDTGVHIPARQEIRDHVFVPVRGGTFRLLESPRRPILLAFLQVLPDSAATPSRREALYLESMQRQYGARGLRVAAIDAPSKVLPSNARHNKLLNASYDWHLTFPLLEDATGSVVSEFHVRTFPTVVLIDDTGVVVQSWEGYTPPALLAQGIERLLGGPLGTIPNLTAN